MLQKVREVFLLKKCENKSKERKISIALGKEYKREPRKGGGKTKAREIRPNPCLSDKSRCKVCKTFSDEERNKIFVSFWELGNTIIQKDWLCVHSHCEPVSEQTLKAETRRKNAVRFFMPLENGNKKKVCLKFFCATIDLGEFAVRNAAENNDLGFS